jgi:hypothetical protein
VAVPNRAGSLVTATAFLLLVVLAAACSSPAQVAVFQVPPGPSRMVPLTADVPVITSRLRALGDTGATVAVNGSSIVVTGGGPLPAPASFFVKTGRVTFRQVLCGAPAYSPSTGAPSPPGPLPACGEQYRTSAANLGLFPHDGVVGVGDLPSDPSFAAYPSTSADDADQPSTTVLLPTDRTYGYQLYARMVLGSAQVQGSAVASAKVQFVDHTWLVECTLTPSGASQWEKATRADFHEYMAVDVDGLVISSPLIEPAQATYGPYGDKMQIAGDLNKSRAEQLAALLESGPLPAPLAA